MRCRHCHAPLTLPLIDLGSSPPSNAYLTAETLSQPETWFPLRVMVCQQCWLAQVEDYAGREALFDRDYAYCSSYLDNGRLQGVDGGKVEGDLPLAPVEGAPFPDGCSA